MMNSATVMKFVYRSASASRLRVLLSALWLFAVLGAPCIARAEEPAPMSAASLATQIATAEAPLILDVRSQEEFQAGHIPGAINIPHTKVESELDQLAPYRGRDVVVYCVSGRRAGLALQTLQKNGFSHLWHLTGDYSGWVNEGRRVETTDSSVPH